jgi:hypothetical protein
MNADFYIAPLPFRVFALITTFLLLLLAAACANGRSTPTSITEIPATATAAITPGNQPTPTPTIPPTSQPTTPTNQPTPTPTSQPTNTATPRPSATATATAVPPESLVNGLPIEQFIIIPPETQAHIRQIFAHGQALGRSARAFSKLGDSIVLTPHFLARFDSQQYDLGIYSNLQPTIEQFAGSFARFGQTTHVGLSARTLFETVWADEEHCRDGETAVVCEVRLHNPSIFLIRLGTNDQSPVAYEANLRHLIEQLLAEGIIPVLGSKADRHEGEDNRNNKILRQLASEYKIPLWDFDRVAETLPDRGLSGDLIHLTMSGSNDYTQESTWQKGYPISDLTALLMLDAIRQIVAAEIRDGGLVQSPVCHPFV